MRQLGNSKPRNPPFIAALVTAVGARVRLPERARSSTPNTMNTANAHHRRTVTKMIGSHRNGWM